MIQYEFTTDPKRFKKRIKSDLQHKLRVALKCYTILNFELHDDKTFTFNAKFRDYRTKITFIPKDKNGNYKLYKGKFSEETYLNGILKVSISIETKNKDEQ